jgi:hypothetical protein
MTREEWTAALGGESPMIAPIGPNVQGSGYCPSCGWGIDLHPLDAEGIDVGRCPTPDERARLHSALPDLYELLRVAADFPPAPSRFDSPHSGGQRVRR